MIRADLHRIDVAGARADPGFAPQPLRLGGVLVLPALSTSLGYDSNVRNQADALGDAQLLIAPSLRARTDWSSHALTLNADGLIRRFKDVKSENSEEFLVNARSRIDVRSNADVTGSIDYGRLIEPRGSAASFPTAAEPVSFERFAAALTGRLVQGRLSFEPNVEYRRLRYDDLPQISGPTLDLSFRDTRTVSGGALVAYRLANTLDAYATASVGKEVSPNATAAQRRDSKSLNTLAGLRGDLSALLYGQVGVGYSRLRYENPLFSSFSGVNFFGHLEYYVAPLVTLVADARQQFQNSGLPTVPGILARGVTLSAYYDIRRNVRLAADATYELQKYRNTSTRVRRPSFRLRAEYQINPRLSVGAFASYAHQGVSGSPLVQRYNAARTGISLTVSP